ncbi:uncharacterized protein LOC142817587 [Rhipicephalus microplus]|uniref:uncharacterized protein LOC142817587 n=1 Tax=Rhipicephalus microplus TaxID=6941 RepID=UPI003F6C1FE9
MIQEQILQGLRDPNLVQFFIRIGDSFTVQKALEHAKEEERVARACFFPYFIATTAECLLPLRLVSSLGEFSGLSCATLNLQKLRQIKWLVNTGVVVSLLRIQDYQKHFSEVKLLKSHFTIHNHSEQVIGNLGFIEASVQYQEKFAPVKFFFVTEKGMSLLGLYAIQALQLVIIGETLTSTAVQPDTRRVQESAHQRGHLPGHEYFTKIQQLSFRLPKEVTDDLARLEQAGLLKRVFHTLLFSPVITNRPLRGSVELNLLTCFQTLLRSSSHFLHRATNGLVYFKHVAINFPSTWPKRSSARRLSSSLFEKGDVRIDLPAESQEQERPFTKQWKLCGKPGEYIKVTPTFLAELNDSTTKTFGNPAYVFVHEWAHYRYGVFDEHGWRDDEKYPLTYCEEDPVTGLRELKLNACSSKFTFDLTLDSGDSCPLNKTTCTFHEKCVMRIKTDVTDTVESSIMFMPYVANVSHFCESTNGARQHNPYAPSEQNAICHGRSTWEVISENEDFTKYLWLSLSSTRLTYSFVRTSPYRCNILLTNNWF